MQGSVPSLWKKENRIYLPKAEKSSYNVPKAYRGISLASVLGKAYERIPEQRLRASMVENGLFDQCQYAYRKDHSTIEAMLYYSLYITKSRLHKEHSITVFVNVEGAFDKVWHQGNNIMYTSFILPASEANSCYI